MKWQTATELTNYGFEVERSYDDGIYQANWNDKDGDNNDVASGSYWCVVDFTGNTKSIRLLY